MHNARLRYQCSCYGRDLGFGLGRKVDGDPNPITLNPKLLRQLGYDPKPKQLNTHYPKVNTKHTQYQWITLN